MDSRTTIPHLAEILGSGVPPAALSFYGRWRQLETWLREVAYVELRAKYGRAWTDHLRGRAPRRAEGDQVNAYMASADQGELLAYADVADLFGLIEDQWPLFERLLPPLRRWQGTTDELRELRNRNAHCRRPHRDDLVRLEQVLRNLESGAQRFYASYLDTSAPEGKRDPLVKAWVLGKHEAAQRLLDHADRQYDVSFRLSYSVRPWAPEPNPSVISGSEGVIWHAHWIVRGRDVNVAKLWAEVSRPGLPRELLVHLLVHPGMVTATFSAVDNPAQIADEIGHVFDDILTTSRFDERMRRSEDDWINYWLSGSDELPRRVQVMSPLTLLDALAPETFPIFAGG